MDYVIIIWVMSDTILSYIRVEVRHIQSNPSVDWKNTSIDSHYGKVINNIQCIGFFPNNVLDPKTLYTNCAKI